ncbi:MAG: YifB family Mg chelatase-like AAA ATPase [Acidiferrobacterales bacterium]|nr:YifB family Mg chelatase-like AAA ATPase [Acidiferrobacterales bacterium]
MDKSQHVPLIANAELEQNLDSKNVATKIKSLAMVRTRTVLGVAALPVVVEVHLANGLPAFSTVGLPETAVRESKDRVRGAIINSGFEFPAKRITVNLAPADIPKTGGRFDLPIAIGILVASGQLPAQKLDQYEMIGELALDGRLRKVFGVLPTALAIAKHHRKLIVPSENATEAALAEQTVSLQAKHLLNVCQYLAGQSELAAANSKGKVVRHYGYPDIKDVKGQQQAKRALEIAASGNHSVLFIGPPGTGKSMLASRLPGILPELSNHQALETAAIQSVTNGQFDLSLWRQRPFRSPHHSASAVALVGGGSNPKPGEISLAHNGILFLDEFTEFARSALEQLREPLESGVINIARANQSVQYPASFLLIAACNPCPCGYLGEDRCSCSASKIENYRAKLSGPMLDRIDLHVHLPRVASSDLQRKDPNVESSRVIMKRVKQVRDLQMDRQELLNSELVGNQLEHYCQLDPQTAKFLENASEQLQLSARAYHRILRLARTIADMENRANLQQKHIAEAIGFRSLDRR